MNFEIFSKFSKIQYQILKV